VIDLATRALEVSAGQLGVVSRLLVSPTARGLGIGGRLLQAAADHATLVGLRPILDVHTVLDAAIRLYERNGWTRIGSVAVPFRQETCWGTSTPAALPQPGRSTTGPVGLSLNWLAGSADRDPEPSICIPGGGRTDPTGGNQMGCSVWKRGGGRFPAFVLQRSGRLWPAREATSMTN
jgi:hypothetical protein